MKVLLLNGSAHIDGCTKRALREVEETLKNEGIETDQMDYKIKEVICYE